MKKTFCILFIIFLICSISPIYPTQAAEIARLVFPNQKNVELLVNNALNRNKGYAVPKLNTHARILIFDLDEKNLKIKKFREIPLPHPAHSMGSVYQTDSGTFIVGYGSNHQITAQELSPSGQIIFELHLKNGLTSYRVQKYKTWDK